MKIEESAEQRLEKLVSAARLHPLVEQHIRQILTGLYDIAIDQDRRIAALEQELRYREACDAEQRWAG